jgi:hypothetical protein
LDISQFKEVRATLSRRLSAFVAVALTAIVLPAGAAASQLIDRGAKGVTLQVNDQGMALLTYRAGGKSKHVLAWGAINAIAPTTTRTQVAFKLDYSGGWGTFRKDVWKTFQDACQPYTGPELQWFVVGCDAPDGSFWALQAWQRALPNYGQTPTMQDTLPDLRLSHWTGDIAQLNIKLDWAYHRYDHLYGTFTYDGAPVFGFHVTPQGAPLDTYGRNVYVDTHDSAYGTGWRRENSFLTHNPTGSFCYGFYTHGARPAGNGDAYRATIIGPGVTPDVYWESQAIGPYNRDQDLVANDEQRAFMSAGDRLCKPN